MQTLDLEITRSTFLDGNRQVGDIVRGVERGLALTMIRIGKARECKPAEKPADPVPAQTEASDKPARNPRKRRTRKTTKKA